MPFVDPLQQPRQYAHQVDALFRARIAQPNGPDAAALVEAQLQASFEQLVASHMNPNPTPQAPPGADAPDAETAVVVAPPPPAASAAPWPTVSPARADQGNLDALIGQVSGRYGVPDWLVKRVVHAESGGNPSATSAVGAMGLMQLMPQTAAGLGVSNPYDPLQNLEGGTRYLRSLLDRFGGDLTKAVAAYNAGPGAVEQYGGVPPFSETQNYVKQVLGSEGLW